MTILDSRSLQEYAKFFQNMLLQISSLWALNKYQRSSLSQMRYKAANLQYFFWGNGNGMLFLVRLQTLQFYYRTGRNHRSFSLKLTKCIGTATLHQKWSFYGPYFSAFGSNTKIFAVIFFRTLLMSLIMWINWSRIVLLKED